MPLNFTWTELWSYYEALEQPDLKLSLEEEVIGQGWLYRQPPKTQELVLKDAPKNFLERVAAEIRPEVAVKMGVNPFTKRR